MDAPRSELVTRHPHVALRGLVRAYHGYAEHTDAPVRRREIPGGRAVLVLGFTPLGVRDGDGPWRRFGSFAAGMHLTPAATAHDGRMAGLEVDLTPLGARTLLGVPMHELTGVTVALEDLLGERAARELTEQTAAGAGWEQRFATVERALMRRAAEAAPPPIELQWAYANLLRRPVGDIAAELGWSHKKLLAAFREHVGLPPKATARVLRFERAVRLLRLGRAPGEVAYAAGYADQAHLTREVRQLGGAPPTRLLQDDFVQDELRAPA